MSTEILPVIVRAACEALDQMFSLAPTASEPHILDQKASHGWDASGIIGLTGGGKGMVVLRLRKTMVNELLTMSGMEATSPDEEEELVNSLLGELTNVVSGHVINTLTEHDLDITVPLIVQGPNHKINWPAFAPVNQVPIKTSLGEMELLVCFALKGAAPQSH